MGLESVKSVNNNQSLTKTESQVSAPGTVAGRPAVVLDQNAKSSKGFSTLSKVLMCVAGATILAAGTAYAMGYFSAVPVEPVLEPVVEPVVEPVMPSIFNNPDRLFKGHKYSVITLEKMNQYFGKGHSLYPDEQRDFYVGFAKSLKEYGHKAIEDVTDQEARLNISMMACKNRENAAEYIRVNGNVLAHLGAKLKDWWTHGTMNRPPCESLAKKYNYDAKQLIEKAGSPNIDITKWAITISQYVRSLNKHATTLQLLTW